MGGNRKFEKREKGEVARGGDGEKRKRRPGSFHRRSMQVCGEAAKGDAGRVA